MDLHRPSNPELGDGRMLVQPGMEAPSRTLDRESTGILSVFENGILITQCHEFERRRDNGEIV